MQQRRAIDHSLLRQVSLFRDLDEPQLAQVGELLKERRYRKGEAIFHQGDPGGCMYLIATGRVRIYLINEGGREMSFRVYGPGSVIGEFAVLDSGPRSASAAAVASTTTYVLYRDDFLGLMREHFALVEHTIATLIERLRYTTSYSAQLAFLNVPERVAAILLQLASTEPNSQPIQLDLTQQELATFANTTREWVNRVLRDLADQQIIRIERGAVIVCDLAGLRARIK